LDFIWNSLYISETALCYRDKPVKGTSVMSIVGKLRRIFDRKTKTYLFILLIAIVGGSFMEMFILSLISPFIAVLLDSSSINSNPLINWVYNFLGFTKASAFLAFMTFVLAAVYVFRGIYFFILNRVQFRFIARRQAALSVRMLKRLLEFSYLHYTYRNIAEMRQLVNSDVGAMFNMIITLLMLLADFFMTLFILLFLLIVSPIMTLCVVALSMLCVLLYFRAFRNQIKVAGEKSRIAQVGMSKAVNQALGGLKEVKVMRREDHFLSVFKTSSDASVKVSTHYRVLDSIPRLAIEMVCFSGAFILLGFFILGGAEVTKLVPQLSLFVLAAFRLLPAITRQVNHVNQTLHTHISVDAVYKCLFEEKDLAAELLCAKDGAVVDPGRDIVVRNLTSLADSAYRQAEWYEAVELAI